MIRYWPWKTIADESWRLLLLGLAVVQGSMILGVERDRLAEARLIERQLSTQQRGPFYNPALDPKSGERLPVLHVTDASGKRLTLPPQVRGQQAVLIFVGSCAPCVADMLKRWQPAIAPRRQVYVITESAPAEVRRFQQLFKLTMPFLFGRRDDVSLRQYNVAWRPRIYLLDDQRRLRYAQPRLEDSERARIQIVRLTERLARTTLARSAIERERKP
jgi:hypothetical protein